MRFVWPRLGQTCVRSLPRVCPAAPGAQGVREGADAVTVATDTPRDPQAARLFALAAPGTKYNNLAITRLFRDPGTFAHLSLSRVE
jgi:hypothetical protein